MRRSHLFVLAALIWGAPGVGVTLRGVDAYLRYEGGDLWWMLLATAVVAAGFFFMFRRIVNRYSQRIRRLPERVGPLQTFPVRGWVLILFMMGLGISLRYVPSLPTEFTASFYCGLGPMLLLSAIRFLRAMFAIPTAEGR